MNFDLNKEASIFFKEQINIMNNLGNGCPKINIMNNLGNDCHKIVITINQQQAVALKISNYLFPFKKKLLKKDNIMSFWFFYPHHLYKFFKDQITNPLPLDCYDLMASILSLFAGELRIEHFILLYEDMYKLYVNELPKRNYFVAFGKPDDPDHFEVIGCKFYMVDFYLLAFEGYFDLIGYDYKGEKPKDYHFATLRKRFVVYSTEIRIQEEINNHDKHQT